MWVWSKLSPARRLDAWELQFRSEPKLAIHLLPGGRSVRLEIYCTHHRKADQLRQQYGGRVQLLKQTDWSASLGSRPPVKIRDRLLLTGETAVAVLRRMAREHPGRQVVSIPAEMAFGTGEHATTASCLRLLVDLARERGWGGSGGVAEAVADLGTGSGVLAVAARRLGAGSVWACDHDPLAVAAARRNVERNRVDRVVVEECDVVGWRPPRRFEVVVANLFSGVLIEALPVMAAALAPGGELVVSGLLAAQAWPVFEQAAAHGLVFTRVLRRGKWITIRGGWMAEHLAAQSGLGAG